MIFSLYFLPREIVSEDVDHFEYSPNSKMPGPFQVINLPDEESMLRKFISHCQVSAKLSHSACADILH